MTKERLGHLCARMCRWRRRSAFCIKHRIESFGRGTSISLRRLLPSRTSKKAQKHPNACKDERGRLRVAAATTVGEDGIRRPMTLLEAECDVIVVDTAHGISKGGARYCARIKRRNRIRQ